MISIVVYSSRFPLVFVTVTIIELLPGNQNVAPYPPFRAVLMVLFCTIALDLLLRPMYDTTGLVEFLFPKVISLE